MHNANYPLSVFHITHLLSAYFPYNSHDYVLNGIKCDLLNRERTNNQIRNVFYPYHYGCPYFQVILLFHFQLNDLHQL